MKRWIASSFAVLALAASVQAQPQIGSAGVPPTTSRPTVSPYLNLNRTGAGAAADYFGLVRPQIEMQRNLQQLQQQQQLMQDAPATGVPATGVIAPTGGGFFFYSHYFPMLNRGATVSGANFGSPSVGIRR